MKIFSYVCGILSLNFSIVFNHNNAHFSIETLENIWNMLIDVMMCVITKIKHD